MKQEIKIDQKLVNKKVREIGTTIEGLDLPHIFAVLGGAMVEVTIDSMQQGMPVAAIFNRWLGLIGRDLINVETDMTSKIPDSVDEN